MKNTLKKSALVFTASFVITGSAYAEINFFDSFEAPLPFVKTDCGFSVETNGEWLTWSKESFACDTADTDVACVDKAKADLMQANQNCNFDLPSLATLKGIVGKDLPNTATDGVTIAQPIVAGQVAGIDFATGKLNDAYTQSDKRYARLVMMSS